MKIKVEFVDPVTDEEHEILMEGPEMDTDELRSVVLEALETAFGTRLPKDINLSISEIASGTIH
jgi:hypothetical protein